MMNETINVIQNHATVRGFDGEYMLSQEALSAIILSAKQAPSWENGQAYSILVFTGKEKEKLANLVEKHDNQVNNVNTIRQSSVFLLFNINLSLYGIDADFGGEIEPLLIGAVDASLALENAAITAESMGLGTCVIGGIRRLSEEIVTTYAYPKYSFPLVGMAIGKATKEKFVKPRLSDINVIYAGQSMDFTDLTPVKVYAAKLKNFSIQAGYTSSDWLDRFLNYYNKGKYPKGTKAVLQKQGLL